jgi:uncharacterized protein (DUF952 family)
MAHIYHITTRTVWGEALLAGDYRPLSLMTEGFIHASTQVQIEKVVRNFYSYLTDLVLLVIETDMVTSEVKWEAPIHPDPEKPLDVTSDELFPHIYGALNVNAVITTHHFPKGIDDFLVWQAQA